MDCEAVKPEAEFVPAEFIHAGNVTAEDICANIRANAGRALPSVGFNRVAVCGNGPSLGDHLDELRQRQAAGWHIATMNGSYNFLLAHRIVPTFFFMVDSRRDVNRKFVTTPHWHTEHIIASQCDPQIFEDLDGVGVTLWHVFNYPGAIEALQETAGPDKTLFAGAYNVGHSCLNPLVAMGYRDMALFGYDCSLRGDARHALKQDNDADEAVHTLAYPLDAENKPIDGLTRTFQATATMAHAAQAMPDLVKKLRSQGIRVELKGDGLTQYMVKLICRDPEAHQVGTASEAKPLPAPAALPRRTGRPTNGLPVVTFKWDGHIPYTVDDVRLWANGLTRSWGHETPFELVCITDRPEELEKAQHYDVRKASGKRWLNGVRVIPMWDDKFEHGRDWHRLKLFAPEMADIIGPRFAVSDLDTVFCRNVERLFMTDAPYKAWRDPNRDQYCTALQLMDAGAFPHVWRDFDPEFTMRLRRSGLYGGYDQAWISYALPGQARWTKDDGVLSFKRDVLMGHEIGTAAAAGFPEAMAWMLNGPSDQVKIINFHGQYKPRDPAVQAAFPWIKDYYQ